MTNVKQSLQETFERTFSVVKCCRLNKPGLSTLRASSRVFSFFGGGGGGGVGGGCWGRGSRGKKNGKESLKSLLRISQARVSDIKNEFQCLYFNLYFSCLTTCILNSSVIFTKLSEAFFCWLALNNRTTLEKKKRIEKKSKV